MRYKSLTLQGEWLDNRGRGYVSRQAAQQAAERRGTVCVETRRLDEEEPHQNDAQGWDAFRLKSGIAVR